MANESTIPTPIRSGICTYSLLIENEEISSEFHVLAIIVSRELNRIPSAMVQLKDGEAANNTFAASNTAHFIPGKKIEIKLGYSSKNETVFKGIIVKHSIKIRKEESMLILECRDLAVKMTGASKNRLFSNKKDSQIIEDLISLHKLKKDVYVEETKVELNEVVQYAASDWDFLICRAEANGQVVMVEDGRIITATPATGSEPVLTVGFGSTVLELDAEIDARLQNKVIKASSWDSTDQTVLVVDAKEPSAISTGNLSVSDLAAIGDGDALQLYHGGKLSEPELQAWADARLLLERLAKVRGRAKFQGIAKVLPGKIIEITGIGDRFAGKYYVSGVRHSLAGGNWETDVQLGLKPELFAETYNLRPLPVSGLLPSVCGLQIGVVQAFKEDPDGEGRVRVNLPQLPLIGNDDGVWARLATLDAGENRGTYFRPEENDEVIVGFLEDDPRYPVILGMCHSSAKSAPKPASKENYYKGYVSREKLKLTFDDEKKIITLETGAGNKLLISEEAKGITMHDQNGNKIVMDDNGIKIESCKDLIFKAKGDVNIGE